MPLPFGDANDTNKANSGTPKKFTTIRKKVSFLFIYIQSAFWFTQPIHFNLSKVSDFIDFALHRRRIVVYLATSVRRKILGIRCHYGVICAFSSRHLAMKNMYTRRTSSFI